MREFLNDLAKSQTYSTSCHCLVGVRQCLSEVYGNNPRISLISLLTPKALPRSQGRKASIPWIKEFSGQIPFSAFACLWRHLPSPKKLASPWALPLRNVFFFFFYSIFTRRLSSPAFQVPACIHSKLRCLSQDAGSSFHMLDQVDNLNFNHTLF